MLGWLGRQPAHPNISERAIAWTDVGNEKTYSNKFDHSQVD